MQGQNSRISDTHGGFYCQILTIFWPDVWVAIRPLCESPYCRVRSYVLPPLDIPITRPSIPLDPHTFIQYPTTWYKSVIVVSRLKIAIKIAFLHLFFPPSSVFNSRLWNHDAPGGSTAQFSSIFFVTQMDGCKRLIYWRMPAMLEWITNKNISAGTCSMEQKCLQTLFLEEKTNKKKKNTRERERGRREGGSDPNLSGGDNQKVGWDHGPCSVMGPPRNRKCHFIHDIFRKNKVCLCVIVFLSEEGKVSKDCSATANGAHQKYIKKNLFFLSFFFFFFFNQKNYIDHIKKISKNKQTTTTKHFFGLMFVRLRSSDQSIFFFFFFFFWVCVRAYIGHCTLSLISHRSAVWHFSWSL